MVDHHRQMPLPWIEMSLALRDSSCQVTPHRDWLLVVVHQLTSEPGAGLVVVRPDGYVGFRCGIASVGQLGAWLALLRKVAINLIQHRATIGSVRSRRKQAAWNDAFMAQLLS